LSDCAQLTDGDGNCSGPEFSERADVVHKTILRAFRKFYSKLFNDVTDYKRLKRRVNFTKDDLLFLSKKFVLAHFGGEPTNFDDPLEIYVAALI
jgi:hypothetical protein